MGFLLPSFLSIYLLSIYAKLDSGMHLDAYNQEKHLISLKALLPCFLPSSNPLERLLLQQQMVF